MARLLTIHILQNGPAISGTCTMMDAEKQTNRRLTAAKAAAILQVAVARREADTWDADTEAFVPSAKDAG